MLLLLNKRLKGWHEGDSVKLLCLLYLELCFSSAALCLRGG